MLVRDSLYSIEARREDRGDLRIVLEAPGATTLTELHEALAREFELGRCPWSFFMSDELWDERSEFAGAPSRDRPGAASARLDRLALRAGSKFVLATEEDRPRVLRFVVKSVQPQPSAPATMREVERSGSNALTAAQKERLELEREWLEAREGMFARAVELCDSETDDDVESLRSKLESARALLGWVVRRAECLLEIEDELDLQPMLSMTDLPKRLWDAGMRDEALALCAEGATTDFAAAFQGEHVGLLASASRFDEADELAQRALAADPDNPGLLFRLATYRESREQFAQALELYRKLAPVALVSGVAEFVGRRIEVLLREQGDEAAARAAHEETRTRVQELEDLEADEEESDEDAGEFEAPVHVGRNEPCPCGSGKKFKKCCGARTEDPEFEARCCADWIRQVLRFAQGEPELREPADCLATFGGEEFRELTLDESLALFTGDESEPMFLFWAALDYVGPIGESVAERFAAHYRTRGTPREREVLARLLGSHLGLYEIAGRPAGGFATLRDVLDESGGTVDVQLETDELWNGTWLVARLILIDGIHHALPGTLEVDEEDKAEFVRRMGEARSSGGLDWSSFLKSHAHRFHLLARELAGRAERSSP